MFQIKASDKITDLTGVGLEYLLDETGEYIRAIFFNGSMRGEMPKVTPEVASEITIKAA